MTTPLEEALMSIAEQCLDGGWMPALVIMTRDHDGHGEVRMLHVGDIPPDHVGYLLSAGMGILAEATGRLPQDDDTC